MLKTLIQNDNNSYYDSKTKKYKVNDTMFFIPKKCKNCNKSYTYKKTASKTFCSGECKYSYIYTQIEYMN